MEVFVAIVNGFHILNVACQRVLDFAPVEGIFMQIINKTFEKFITMNLVSEICSYCSISRLLTFIARFYTFPQQFFGRIAKRTCTWILHQVRYMRKNKYPQQRNISCPKRNLSVSCHKIKHRQTLVYNICTVCSFPHGHAQKAPEVLRVKIPSQMYEFK